MKRYFCAFAVILLATFSGCGPDRPDTAPVFGKVTFNGKPVTSGTITFYPEEGRSSLAKIQPDGTYRLTTFEESDGALPGKHAVTIKATQVSGDTMPHSFEAELAQGTAGTGAGAATTGTSTVTWLVPQTYSDRSTSGLTAVVEDKSNEIDFNLPQ